MSESQKQVIDLARLERSISRAKVLAAAAFLLAPSSYLFWFWFVNSQSLSVSSDDWGTFGDFIGGVLNPLVAFFAFYWLTQSIKLQKEELSETRIALAEASRAQKEQAQHQYLANKLLALDSKLRISQSEVEYKLKQIEFYVGHGHKRVYGYSGKLVDSLEAIRELYVELKPLVEYRDSIQASIDSLLKETMHGNT